MCIIDGWRGWPQLHSSVWQYRYPKSSFQFNQACNAQADAICHDLLISVACVYAIFSLSLVYLMRLGGCSISMPLAGWKMVPRGGQIPISPRDAGTGLFPNLAPKRAEYSSCNV